MIPIFAIAALYITIFMFTWLHMYRMVTEVCEDIHRSLMHEIGMCKLAGDDLNFAQLQGLAEVLVSSFRTYSIRNSIVQNIWMCFVVMTCAFSDSSDFEQEFKSEFKASALKSFLEEIQDSGNPMLEEFKDIVHAASLKA